MKVMRLRERGAEEHALGGYWLTARDPETEKPGSIEAGPYRGKWPSEKKMECP